MALFKPYKITSDKLADLPVREGQIVITTDTKKLYVDVSATERIEVTSDAEVDLSNYVTTTMLSSAIGQEASERQKQDNLLDDKINTKLDTTQADNRYALKDNPKLTGNVDISNEDWQGGKITAAHSNGETDDFYKYVIGFDGLHRPYIAKKEGENTLSTIYLDSESIVFSKPLSFTDSSGVSTNPEAANQTRENIGAAAVDHIHDVATADTDGFMSAEDKTKLDSLEKIDTSDFVTKEDADATYAAITHTHDDRYYTEGEVDSKLANKANTTHTHAIGDINSLQETIEGLEEDIAGKANASHTHDDRYFTESEVTERLATKADTGHKHAASDVTSGTFALDRIPTITDAKISGMSASKLTGTIPTANLPSYVDDVVEGATTEDFPGTGEAGKIYVATSTNKTYRWSGSGYVEISASLALGTTSSTAFRGDYGNVAYTHATAKGAAFGSGLYKITTNAQGHVTAATAVTKADIIGLGIPAQDTNTNTTYTLSKSGSTITLSGSDGSKTSVTDDNTTYSLSSFGITATAAELNKLDGVTATAAEINYLDGVTSAIQTQLNGKAASSHTHSTATTSAAGFLPTLGGGTTNFLRADGTWAKPPDTNTTYSDMKGATSSAAGTHGLVPAPAKGSANRYLRSDGTWSVPPDTNTTYSTMKGATSSAAGATGLVPAPAAGAATRYLRSDGTWQVPPDTNTTYTLSSFGITATAAELNKLDGVTTTATQLNYLNTLTGNVQTQLNGKAASSHTHSYLPLSGGTLTGRLIANGRISTTGLNGGWSNGRTITNAAICFPTASTTDGSRYDPYLAGETTAGYVWNFGGGASDQVGFFGYKKSDSSNSTLWQAYLKVSDGTAHFSKTVYAPTFSGALSGNASTATTATQANYWTTARTLTFTGNVTGSVSIRGNANMSCALTLANDSVTSAKIAANAVTSSEIASGAVGLSELSSDVGTVAVQSATPTDSHVKLWIKV